LGLLSRNYYSSFRNRLNSVIRTAKAQYYKRSLQISRRDLKKTWKVLNSITGSSKGRDTIQALLVDGESITDKMQIAECFNEYFSRIPSELESSIPTTENSPLSYVNFNSPNSFFTSPVTASEVEAIVRKLKNTTFGIDSVPVAVFKKISSIISGILADIINKSFADGKFPSLLKEATVIPIHKTGSKIEVGNYRPISLLPLCSKIFERAMYDRIASYACKYRCIDVNQFGFQRKRSTVDALVSLTEIIYNNLNLGNHTLGIFVDFRKAFDTVSHNVLFKKLECYGMRGLTLEWLASYLSDRKQRVKIGSSISASSVIKIGVPQGSILGPLLFLLYINDLPKISDSSKFTLFADDTTMCLGGSDYSILMDCARQALKGLYDWTVCNRLSLNTEKTSVMLFTNRKQCVETPSLLNINGCFLHFESDVRFLGVKLSPKLDFATHVDLVADKLAKVAGIFHRIRDYVDVNTMISLYYALVYPHLTYCSIVWSGCSLTVIRPLLVAQKKVIRLVNNQDYLAHTTPLFLSSGILKFEELSDFLLGIHMYKLNARNMVAHRQHEHFTRNRYDASTPFHRLTQTQRAVSFRGPQVWNDIPQNIRDSETLNAFKCSYKSLLLSRYAQ